jgi:hypothetical protein
LKLREKGRKREIWREKKRGGEGASLCKPKVATRFARFGKKQE